jgi:tetraacyldisaccharide 4'-kinase
MKAPRFWIDGGPLSVLLAPAGLVWAYMAERRQRNAHITPHRAPLPVICVGNAVAGGAGKTPVALSLAGLIEGANFLSRGYGGRAEGPLKVDVHHHSYAEVGDEPLLLAEAAPCWVAKDRVAGARAAAQHGARCLIMDDGFQDPSLIKDIALLVVDGHVGFGSGRCIPAGPLREPVDKALARASAVVILGEDRKKVAKLVGGRLPVLHAHLQPEPEAQSLRGETVVAFAGIGRPAKFFHTLERLGAKLVEAYAFPDHHPYHPTEIGELLAKAETHAAALVTTTKDLVRIPPHLREQIGVLRIEVDWQDEDALMRVIARAIA